VVGLSAVRIPLSRDTVAVPVFFVSASASAVNVSVGTYGLGKFASVGAVYVNTLDPFAVLVVQLPNDPVSPLDPPLNDPPEVHVPVTAVGLGVEVVGAGVYEYWHVQFVTVVTVEPPTVAVNVCTCPAITPATLGETVTVITFALELPHPEIHRASPAQAISIAFFALHHFMDPHLLAHDHRNSPWTFLFLFYFQTRPRPLP
ncbi:MAG TPA: hypothetical protein VLX60_14735, partial [Terriglobales bacterium]|nr:hypothetical protein [Terriglobales bacterium]